MKIVLLIMTFAVMLSEHAKVPLDFKLEQASYSILCVMETKIDPRVVFDTLHDEWAKDPKLEDWSLCFSQRFGMQRADGSVDISKVRRYQMRLHDNDKVMVDKIVQDCGPIHRKTAKATALAINKCFQKYFPSDAY